MAGSWSFARRERRWSGEIVRRDYETQKVGFCGPFFPDAYGVSMQYRGTAIFRP